MYGVPRSKTLRFADGRKIQRRRNKFSTTKIMGARSFNVAPKLWKIYDKLSVKFYHTQNVSLHCLVKNECCELARFVCGGFVANFPEILRTK